MLFIWIRQLVAYGLAVGVLIALVVIIPRFARLRVSPDYSDIENLLVDQSLNTDTGYAFAKLKAGDAVAFRLGDEETLSVCLGWVAGMPGDQVSIQSGTVMINRKPAGRGDKIDVADRPAVMVPAGHCFVLSSRHQFDSLAYGFIPAGAYLGKLGSLP